MTALLLAAPATAGVASEASPDPSRGDWLAAAGCTGEGLLVGHIEVVAKDIFDLDDPAENRRLYRWADYLHRATREGAVRNALLFDSGDPYFPGRLQESERALRARHSIRDATVEPVACHDGLVDVRVVTHDTWTLGAGVSFGRSGGANTQRFELSDSNFLGTGKEVLLRYRQDIDRDGYEARYVDPELFGTHNRLGVSYFGNDDGNRWVLEAGRPFFSLDTRWAAEGRALGGRRVDHLYQRGEIVDGFGHQEDLFEISGGWSPGLAEHGARRLRFGFTRERHTFEAVADPLSRGAAAGEVREATPEVLAGLPAGRSLSYPWIGFELVQDEFLETADLDQIGRTEDRYLGTRLSARLGYSSPLFGGDRGRAVGNVDWLTAWRATDRVLVELGANASGRFGEELEDAIATAHTTLYWRDIGEQLLFVGISGEVASNLDRDHQLLLGGDTGLRGYPLRFQDGDRRFLLTVEQRVFTDWYPWHLFRVGGAAFFDVGRAWFHKSGAIDGDDLDRVLADVGVGLRLGLDRSGRGSMLHFDVALPLVRDGSFGGVQWLVSTQRSF